MYPCFVAERVYRGLQQYTHTHTKTQPKSKADKGEEGKQG